MHAAPAELQSKIDFLVDAWCARKELIPLRRLLNGAAGINGLTDGWAELLAELRAIRAQDAARLRAREMDVVVEVQHLVGGYLDR